MWGPSQGQGWWRYRPGVGWGGRTTPCRLNTANRHTANRFFISLFQPPCFPSLTCQLQVPRPPPSLRLCPLQGSPWALPWPHVAKGTEAPPRSRCAPPPRPHPDMGNKVQRRQKNDTQAYEGWHGARCGPWPTEPEPCLSLASPPSQFCEWELPLPKIAQKPVAPMEWGDRIPSLGWLVGSL